MKKEQKKRHLGKSQINLIILTIIEPPLWRDTGDTKMQSIKETQGGRDGQTHQCPKEPHVQQYTS